MATLEEIISGFGTSPFGTSPFGTAMALEEPLELEEVIALRENLIRVTFNVAPRFTLLNDPNDAASADRYSIAPVDGTFGRDGDPAKPVTVVFIEQVEDTGGTVLDLILDRPMSPAPAQYDLTFTGLVTAVGQIPFATTTITFLAVFKGISPPTPDLAINNRDIANPQSLSALYDPLPISTGQDLNELLGTYQPDAQGDLAFDEGLTAYKKRVFRRLITKRGTFAHLPNYGVSVPQTVQQLARIGVREQLAIEAESQIRQEPETVDVSVNIVIDNDHPDIARYQIKARTSFGPNIDFDVPVSFSPTGT